MKITLERIKCIGCGTCASVCPTVFVIDTIGKSHLKEFSGSDSNEIEEIEVKEERCAKEAAEFCPVQCIKVK